MLSISFIQNSPWYTRSQVFLRTPIKKIPPPKIISMGQIVDLQLAIKNSRFPSHLISYWNSTPLGNSRLNAKTAVQIRRGARNRAFPVRLRCNMPSARIGIFKCCLHKKCLLFITLMGCRIQVMNQKTLLFIYFY